MSFVYLLNDNKQMKMSGNRGNRHADDRKHRGEPPVDLENQFIMRLPEVNYSQCH